MNRKRLVTLIEIAIISALAFVFSKIQFAGFWPNGGSISLVMVPIAVLAYRRGVGAGVVSGLIVGLLKAFIGGYVIHPAQFLLDYPIAFAVLGLSGLFVRHGQKINLASLIGGIAIGGTLRLLSHVISGVLWFGDGQANVWLFSFMYNVGYILPEIIITAIVIGIFHFRFSHLLKPSLQ